MDQQLNSILLKPCLYIKPFLHRVELVWALWAFRMVEALSWVVVDNCVIKKAFTFPPISADFHMLMRKKMCQGKVEKQLSIAINLCKNHLLWKIVITHKITQTSTMNLHISIIQLQWFLISWKIQSIKWMLRSINLIQGRVRQGNCNASLHYIVSFWLA